MATKSRRAVLQVRKNTFYNKHQSTIDRWSEDGMDWRDQEIRSFIEEARDQIGYADSTAPCDIYYALLSLTPTYKKRREVWQTRSLSSQNKDK